MRSLFKSVLIISALCLAGVSPAKAEVFFWQAPDTKLSVTFPDTWRMIHDQKGDDVLTVLAPGENDHAGCRLRVREDRRFVIYPARFSAPIQRLNFSKDFWEDYLGEYNNAVLNSVTDNAGLGRGLASYADASYITSTGLKMEKRALLFVSLYNDKEYILECSAEAHAYDKWYHSFLSVAKSVDFRKVIHEFPSGHYRDFSVDGPVKINNARKVETAYY